MYNDGHIYAQGFNPIVFLKRVRLKRAFFALFCVMLMLMPGGFGALTRTLTVDAYVQVSAFVGATLLLFYGAERLFHFDIGTALKKAKGFQVPLAALLGATPGCGGAVVVVAAYSSGNVGFGAMVATLTATMGDAAFLLIATRPDAAAVVLPLSFIVGVLSGWIVDRLDKATLPVISPKSARFAPHIGITRPKDYLFALFILPGLVIGVTQLLGKDISAIFGDTFIYAVALSGTVVGLYVWATSPLQAMTNVKDSPLTRMAEETSFIAIWVIVAYLTYDYAAEYAGLDLKAAFTTIAPLLPLIAVIIGFIPGCGPQVLVATLYINGALPFAALIGNAISNDGDALFPAIAINPKAAIWATLYSAIPALVVAYGFYFLAPTFMN